MKTLTNVFKALSDETRLQMLGLLVEEGELCVCDFVEVLEITQSKASRHLRHLVNVGLLDDRRAGTWVYFRVAEAPGAEQEEMLAALPGLLCKRLPKETRQRFRAWMKSKERPFGRCKRA